MTTEERVKALMASESHPHEPEIPPALDGDGRCLVCGLITQLAEAVGELRQMGTEVANAVPPVRFAELPAELFALADRLEAGAGEGDSKEAK